MTSDNVLWGLAGAAVIYVVLERRRKRSAKLDGEGVAASVLDDDDDDGPESEGKPCCAGCASSSLWSGCGGGTKPTSTGIGGGKTPVVEPWILTAPGPKKPTYYKPGTGIMPPGRAPALNLLSRTGATIYS